MGHEIFSRHAAPDTLACATHRQWHSHHLCNCAGDPTVLSGNYIKHDASDILLEVFAKKGS